MKIIEADKENPLDEYSPMVEEMKQMMRGNTEVVSEFVESDIFDEIMDDESEDGEVYEKIKEIIDKVKGAGDMKRPLHQTDEKIATLTKCEESYAKGYEDGRKAGHLEGCRDEYEAMASYLRSVLEELRP